MTRHSSTTLSTATRGAVLLSGLALALLVPHGPAIAGDDRVERTGSCSEGARWDLKVKTDDGRLEVEGEVDSNRNGQTWAWRIKHNGDVSARGKKTTKGPSGSFSVERRVVNLQGTDNIMFVARHGGQTCRGVVNF